MRVTKSACFTEPHSVNYGSMIESIADDCIVLAQEGLKEPAVGIKAGRVENRIVSTEKSRNSLYPLILQDRKLFYKARSNWSR